MPLKIAVFTETFLPNLDGIASVLQLMLQRLQEQGHRVVLFGPPDGPKEYAGAEIIGVGGPRFPLYPVLRINIPRRHIWQRVQQFQPDLIHAVNPTCLGLFGMIYARRLRVPLLASFHTNLPRYLHYYGGPIGPFLELPTWGLMRAIHNQADVNLCTSRPMLQELRSRGFKRMRVWKRGIDIQRFQPGPRDEAMRARLTDGNPDEFLVVNVGRHGHEKRLDLIRDPLFAHKGVRLAMVGGGPAHEDLKQHFRGTPTVFPGYMQGDELVAAYRAADVFLFPSTTETFGLVALEAMACRVPVIAASAGGVLDIVQDGKNGLLFDPTRPQQIGPLVQRLRDDTAERERLADNALEHARSRDWRATMDQLIDYYHLTLRLVRGRREQAAVPGQPVS
jgi:glycosyltransferase involved in cell wall biosynthesis